MSNNQQNLLSPDLNQAIKMIGDDHVLCIIGNLRAGGMRFNELQRALKINPTTLTDRLCKLEKEMILLRKEETLTKTSVVYELTHKGQAVLPIIDAIGTFAKKYVDKTSADSESST